jgi:hypothetical protein
LSQLAHLLIDNDPAYAHEASGSHALLASAMNKVLASAYAAGFTLVAGRCLPALCDHYRLRAGYRSPWLLLDRDVQGALSVRMAWSKRRSWTSIEVADQAQPKGRTGSRHAKNEACSPAAWPGVIGDLARGQA